MELYIEKEFLDNFYLEYNENQANLYQKIVVTIIKEYPEINWYVDIKMDTTLEEFDKLKTENRFFALFGIDFPPTPIESIEIHFSKNKRVNQTLIFTQNEESWFSEAERKGALCFSYDNYQQKIKEIIDKCHIKIDLNEQFQGWGELSGLKEIPVNKIIINDSYILTDKFNQKMDKNLFPLLKNIICNQTNIEIDIFTKNFNPPQDVQVKKEYEAEWIKNEAAKRFNRLNSAFSNYKVKFKIINNSLKTGNYDFHDRLIYLNYFIIDCPKGFNLIPHKNSNSQISVESIFDKYTYKRLKGHIRSQNEYFEKVKKYETFEFKYI